MEQEKLINFSAADLVKKSAAQIKYFYDRKIKYVSDMQKMGVQYQKEKAESLGITAEEFRGSYKDGNILIHFSNDMITDDKIIEVKMIIGEYEDWFLEGSLLQCAFYKSMIMLSETDPVYLFTPKFRIKEGYEREIITVPRNIDYHLLFGNDEYNIVVNNPKKIVDFFVEKAKIIAESSYHDYDNVKKHDEKFKFKYFQLLNYCFSYNMIDKNKEDDLNVKTDDVFRDLIGY